MLLKDLIQWLELQDASAVVRDGFGAPLERRIDAPQCSEAEWR